MERFRFDRSSKWLIDHHADAILRIAGVDDVVSFKPLANEVVQPRQIPDGLLEVQRQGSREPNLYLVEIETYPDRRIDEQIADDLMLVYQARRVVPEVILVVLCPKGNVQTPTRFTAASLSGGSRIAVHWPVIELWKVSANAMLETRDPGMTPWISLMESASPPEEILRTCQDIIDQHALPNEKANLQAVCQVLAGLRYDMTWLQTFFGGEEAMIESPVLQDFLEKQLAKRMHRSIMRLLIARMGPIPSDLKASVENIADEEKLDSLITLAGTCLDLDSFRQELAKLSS